jgi:hypothetical protein
VGEFVLAWEFRLGQEGRSISAFPFVVYEDMTETRISGKAQVGLLNHARFARGSGDSRGIKLRSLHGAHGLVHHTSR